jgi:hypothetical protein
MSKGFEGQSSFLAACWRLQERVELNLDWFDERGKKTGMLPNGPSHRALPRLYSKAGSTAEPGEC